MVIFMERLIVVEKFNDFLGDNTIYEYYDDNKYLGEFCIIQEYDDDNGESCVNYICNVKIIPLERGKGYGTRMLQTLLEEYPHETFTLHVEVINEIAFMMYKKLGFELISTKRECGTIAHKMMKRGKKNEI